MALNNPRAGRARTERVEFSIRVSMRAAPDAVAALGALARDYALTLRDAVQLLEVQDTYASMGASVRLYQRDGGGIGGLHEIDLSDPAAGLDGAPTDTLGGNNGT